MRRMRLIRTSLLKQTKSNSKAIIAAAKFVSWLIDNNQSNVVLNIISNNTGIEILFPFSMSLQIGTTYDQVYYSFSGPYSETIQSVESIKRWFAVYSIKLEERLAWEKEIQYAKSRIK